MQILCCTDREETDANGQTGELVKLGIIKMNEDWWLLGAGGQEQKKDEYTRS